MKSFQKRRQNLSSINLQDPNQHNRDQEFQDRVCVYLPLYELSPPLLDISLIASTLILRWRRCESLNPEGSKSCLNSPLPSNLCHQCSYLLLNICFQKPFLSPLNLHVVFCILCSSWQHQLNHSSSKSFPQHPVYLQYLVCWNHHKAFQEQLPPDPLDSLLNQYLVFLWRLMH